MTKHTPTKRDVIHFHSCDYRFCGSRKVLRRFSFEDDEVTCPHCLEICSAALARFAEPVPTGLIAEAAK